MDADDGEAAGGGARIKRAQAHGIYGDVPNGGQWTSTAVEAMGVGVLHSGHLAHPAPPLTNDTFLFSPITKSTIFLTTDREIKSVELITPCFTACPCINFIPKFSAPHFHSAAETPVHVAHVSISMYHKSVYTCSHVAPRSLYSMFSALF